MVESQSSKLMTRVQFPSSAPEARLSVVFPQFFKTGFAGLSFFCEEVEGRGCEHHDQSDPKSHAKRCPAPAYAALNPLRPATVREKDESIRALPTEAE